MGTDRTTISRRALLAVGGITLVSACGKQVSNTAGKLQTTATGEPSFSSGDSHSTTPTGTPTVPSQRTTSPADPTTHPPSSTPTGSPSGSPTGTPSDEPVPPGVATRPEYYVDAGYKHIALTIDDGPTRAYTPQVLSILQRYGITATFCMLGRSVQVDTGIVREVSEAGHLIANHTWSHADMSRHSVNVILDEMNRTTDAVASATGKRPTVFRAPYGAWSRNVFVACAREGMRPLDWSVDPRDWSRPGTSSIVRNVMRNTRTGSIILEHDGGGPRAETVEALGIFIPQLLEAGYHFVTV